MTLEQVVKRFKQNSPKDCFEIMRTTGVSMTYVAEGAYRAVFQINSLPLIVKIPFDKSEDSQVHVGTEVSTIRRIKRSKNLEPLRKYLPELYYASAHGVVLMKKYFRNNLPYITRREIAKEVNELLDLKAWDRSTDNFGLDEETQQIKILDFGCMDKENRNDLAEDELS